MLQYEERCRETETVRINDVLLYPLDSCSTIKRLKYEAKIHQAFWIFAAMQIYFNLAPFQFFGVVTVGGGLEQNWIMLKWEFGVGNLCGLCVTAVCHINKSHIHRHESYTSTQFIQHSVLHYDSLSQPVTKYGLLQNRNMLINVFSANNFTPS